jgi:uncharacterized protein YndB with AHSA1/START domain
MTERSVTHATFVIERVYDATPRRVFAAWSDPKAKRRWYVDGEGFLTDAYELDFRVGGAERARGGMTNGMTYANDTLYQDIVPGERIVFAYAMDVNGKRISASLATVEFKPEGKGTRMVFTEQGAFFEGSDTGAGREQGWKSLLDGLGKELERSPS